VQVHPGDEMARRLHHAYGKSEMWYILKAAPGAKIYCGFRKGIEMPAINEAINQNSISDLLNAEEVQPGDFFDIPAGMVHAIGEGVVLAEIQQSSDITYRIFDWNRTDINGNSRELHTKLAMEAISLKTGGGKGVSPELMLNETFTLVSNTWFTTNILSFNTFITKDYNLIDSFVIFMCVSGGFTLHWDKGTETVTSGESVLIPAMIREIVLEPKPAATVLEVYVSPAADKRNS
jgi:mannose-6-phosphate isomerase